MDSGARVEAGRHMAAEIAEQPEAVARTLDRLLPLRAELTLSLIHI